MRSLRSLRSLFLASAVIFLPLLAGCSTEVDTAPATGEALPDESSTTGMTETEAEEFEAGEGGDEGEE